LAGRSSSHTTEVLNRPGPGHAGQDVATGALVGVPGDTGHAVALASGGRATSMDLRSWAPGGPRDLGAVQPGHPPRGEGGGLVPMWLVSRSRSRPSSWTPSAASG